jgi:hypothetical protein
MASSSRSVWELQPYPETRLPPICSTERRGDARDLPREHEACPIGSGRALDTAIITAPQARDPALLAKLDAVAGRVLGR